MKPSHIICLMFAILFTAAALVAAVLALTVSLTPPAQQPQPDGSPESGVQAAVSQAAAGCARGFATVVFGIAGAVCAAIGMIFSAVGWNARPRGARIAFRVLLILNVLSVAVGLLAPALLSRGA